SYVMGDVTTALANLVGTASIPTKFLLHYSLAYFTPAQLSTILRNMRAHLKGHRFRFLLTGIPNNALQGSLYDTEERRARHLENEKVCKDTNDGLGRWWAKDEIEGICRNHGLTVAVRNQMRSLSNYRMDVLISADRNACPA